jgi:hypothetical protein
MDPLNNCSYLRVGIETNLGCLTFCIILHFLETKREVEPLKQHFINKLELEAEALTRLRQGLQEFKQQNKIHLFREQHTSPTFRILDSSFLLFCI